MQDEETFDHEPLPPPPFLLSEVMPENPRQELMCVCHCTCVRLSKHQKNSGTLVPKLQVMRKILDSREDTQTNNV